SDRLAARMQIAFLGQRDQLLDDRTQVLGLGQRGGDLLVLDQRRGEMLEQRDTLVRAAIELAVGVAVTHRVLPWSSNDSPGSGMVASCVRSRRGWPGQARP